MFTRRIAFLSMLFITVSVGWYTASTAKSDETLGQFGEYSVADQLLLRYPLLQKITGRTVYPPMTFFC